MPIRRNILKSVKVTALGSKKRGDAKSYKKPTGKEIMNDHSASHDVLIDIMDNVVNSDKEGNFTITYNGQELNVRQLG